MARFLLLCFVLMHAFVAMAIENAQTSGSYEAVAPAIRKLGKHRLVKTVGTAPASSPSQVPRAEKNMHPVVGSPYPLATSEPNDRENVSVEGEGEGGEAIHLEKPHHSMDKSVAGGGVILGGLATTFLVAVFCYIKATGRHKRQSDNETSN
ncbi:hypothetical protein GQ457_08G019680 [Hibiscus cannabinus]